MRFFIQTFGCRVNLAESETLALKLQKLGFQSSPVAVANIVIVNSCAVTAKALREVRQFINQIKTQSPQTQIFVTGCAATLWQQNKEVVKNIDLVIDNANKKFLAKIITQELALDIHPGGVDHTPGVLSSKFLNSTRLMVKIQDGCDYFCTFCIVPYLRGRSRSENTQTIIKYIKSVQKQTTVNEAVLAGINLGLYPNLPKLVQQVLEKTNLPKISFGSLYVENLKRDFFQLYQSATEDRLTRYFHVPLQSGSPKILSLMQRRYKLKEFTEKINALKQAVPDALIATDIIVGFFEETDADFAETYQYLEKSPITRAHIFKFSRREGTAAYFMAKRMQEPDAATKVKRSQAIHKLFNQKLSIFKQKLFGQKLRALVIKLQPDSLLGFLDNGLEIIIPVAKKLPLGFVDVKIEKVSKGKLVASLAA